jgi:4-hydroxybenzoate polyprenyltransferase
LALGRVSNLPTVWTNVWAGAVLSGAQPELGSLLLCAVGISMLYVGGMFLNDAFDRELDKIERPERPIPQGWISAHTVFLLGFGLLVGGVASVAATPLLAGAFRFQALASAALLALAIVAYNARHKGTPWAPWLMGVCRGLVYVCAAMALSQRARWQLDPSLGLAALALGGYVVGLTYVARGEGKNDMPVHWPLALVFSPLAVLTWSIVTHDLPPATWLPTAAWLLWVRQCLSPLLRGSMPVMRSVIQLIAGISLVDAAFAALVIGPMAAAVGIAGTLATLYLQKLARGT